MAASGVLMSKTFDNGMICASEQSVVAVKEVYKQVKDELQSIRLVTKWLLDMIC